MLRWFKTIVLGGVLGVATLVAAAPADAQLRFYGGSVSQPYGPRYGPYHRAYHRTYWRYSYDSPYGSDASRRDAPSYLPYSRSYRYSYPGRYIYGWY
jgi:hypothetical protein